LAWKPSGASCTTRALPRSANKKDLEGGKDHPDRDAQFNHINMTGLKMQLQGFPILSIDGKRD
jgi:hypothetical protein